MARLAGSWQRRAWSTNRAAAGRSRRPDYSAHAAWSRLAPSGQITVTGIPRSRASATTITAAWALGFRKWAHALGHGGHFLTKSRRYSVTFGQLRRARAEYRKQLRHPYGDKDPWGRDLNETTVLIIKTWHYAGTGYTRSPGARQATAAEARAREHDR
jgi:hypothetical protein